MNLELTEWELQLIEFLVCKQFQELMHMENMNMAAKHSYFVDLKRLLLKLQKTDNNK